MKKLKTYIGICDFMSQKQVLEMASIFQKYRHVDVALMVGTMTSFKVLNNQETKWSMSFPKPYDLKNIFKIKDNSIINCIHYADYENNSDLSKTLKKVIELCGENLNAIQLDMVWPDPKELELLQKQSPIPVVLQISKRSMIECGDNTISVAKQINNEYQGLISHVLLDCSMGKGIIIDTVLIERYIQSINRYAPSVDIAIAGGLGPETVSEVKDLIKNYRVSIDAQSNLRTSGKAQDPIDWNLAKKYLHKAVGFYI